MKTFAQLFFENNAFIINGGILKLKIWTSYTSKKFQIYDWVYDQFSNQKGQKWLIVLKSL